MFGLGLGRFICADKVDLLPQNRTYNRDRTLNFTTSNIASASLFGSSIRCNLTMTTPQIILVLSIRYVNRYYRIS